MPLSLFSCPLIRRFPENTKSSVLLFWWAALSLAPAHPLRQQGRLTALLVPCGEAGWIKGLCCVKRSLSSWGCRSSPSSGGQDLRIIDHLTDSTVTVAGPANGPRPWSQHGCQRCCAENPRWGGGGLRCLGVRSPRSRLTALDLGFSSPSRHPSFIYAQAHR
uniref:Uncharacterized protein n=1 Tax=Rangifer tarandus platyrhynchus TaxID=3082113 RepID=A0ACB0EZF1_RANTA|nr:unnamed protein product [Rangifer tarandus platyrhynchus]